MDTSVDGDAVQVKQVRRLLSSSARRENSAIGENPLDLETPKFCTQSNM